MPSINLIWDQRLIRRKNQRIATALLLISGLAVLGMAQELVRTTIVRRGCQQGIAACEERIRAKQEDAQRNKKAQNEIAGLQPTLSLLQETQHITLRWVSLMGELDRCITNPKEFCFNALSFSAASAPAAQPAKPDPGATPPQFLIGSLVMGGTARDYYRVVEAMRAVARQRHVGVVRLSQASALGARQGGLIRFNLRADFRIPEDEEKVLATADTRPAGVDYSAVLEKAGEQTVLSRVPPAETASP